MTRLITILCVSAPLWLSFAQEAPPMPGPVPVRRQSFLQAIFNPRPQFVTNRITLSWAAVPNAYGYNVYCGTNANDLSWQQQRTLNTSCSFVFVNRFGQRPARWFFAVSAFDAVRESELTFVHWPNYPPVLDGMRIFWDEPNLVTLETCSDFNGTVPASDRPDELEFVTWTTLPPVNGTEVILPIQPGNHFYRDASGVLSLNIEPVFVPDPRDR